MGFTGYRFMSRSFCTLVRSLPNFMLLLRDSHHVCNVFVDFEMFNYTMHTCVLDVCPLIENVSSETTFAFPLECAMKCAQDPFCAGYNFKSKQQERNCQLTSTLSHNFYNCNANDKGWIFYHSVGSRKVQKFMHFNAIKS